MRKLLTIHGQYHPKADVDHLYVPRKQGGRGLVQIEGAWCRQKGPGADRRGLVQIEGAWCRQKGPGSDRRGLVQIEGACTVEIIKLVEELDSKEDPQIQTVIMHQHNINSAMLQAAQITQGRITKRNKTNKGKHKRENERWQGERAHGQLPRNLDEKLLVMSGPIKG